MLPHKEGAILTGMLGLVCAEIGDELSAPGRGVAVNCNVTHGTCRELHGPKTTANIPPSVTYYEEQETFT